MTKRLVAIFLLAFALNYVWEHLHSLLYASYQGGAITEFILLRATLADAAIITLISFAFIVNARARPYAWLIVPIGFLVSAGIELRALAAGRWAYNALMPIIPLLGTGLTPTIQLGLLGYACYWLVMRPGRS